MLLNRRFRIFNELDFQSRTRPGLPNLNRINKPDDSPNPIRPACLPSFLWAGRFWTDRPNLSSLTLKYDDYELSPRGSCQVAKHLTFMGGRRECDSDTQH